MRRLDRSHANFLGLLLGFGFGQGSALVAGSLLLARGEAASLAAFGATLALASFSLWFADFGAVFHAGRKVAANEPFSFLCAAFLPRLVAIVLGLAPFAALAAGVFGHTSGGPWVFQAALLAPAMVWLLNMMPLFDGMRLSGLSGLLSSLPWPVASLVMLAAPPEDAAAATVAGFVAGALVSVAIQHVLAARLGRGRFTLLGWDAGCLAAALRFGAAFTVAQLPAQVYGRAVILLVGGLGPSAQAAYVYIKNIVNALAQLLVFARRIQYFNLAAGTASAAAEIRWSTLVGNLIVALVASAATAALVQGVRAGRWLPGAYDQILDLLPWFVIVLVFWSAASYLSNLLLLRERPYGIAVTNLLVTGMSLGGILALQDKVGLKAIVISEILMHLCQVAIFIKLLRRAS